MASKLCSSCSGKFSIVQPSIRYSQNKILTNGRSTSLSSLLSERHRLRKSGRLSTVANLTSLSDPGRQRGITHTTQSILMHIQGSSLMAKRDKLGDLLRSSKYDFLEAIAKSSQAVEREKDEADIREVSSPDTITVKARVNQSKPETKLSIRSSLSALLTKDRLDNARRRERAALKKRAKEAEENERKFEETLKTAKVDTQTQIPDNLALNLSEESQDECSLQAFGQQAAILSATSNEEFEDYGAGILKKENVTAAPTSPSLFDIQSINMEQLVEKATAMGRLSIFRGTIVFRNGSNGSD